MRKRVHLHGAFAAFHDGPIEVVAATVWEAIELVTRQLPGFKPDLDGRKRVQVAGFYSLESLRAPTNEEDIHVFPALTFAKRQGVIQTIIGVVLIITAIAIAPMDEFTGGTLSLKLFMMGLSLVIGGVMQMLYPVPKPESPEKRSKYLPSTQNTVKIGTPIPLLYGEYRCGGHIMSLNIDAKDVGKK
jgi:predicted phage tail protein